MSSSVATPPGHPAAAPAPGSAASDPGPARPPLNESFASSWRCDLPAGLVVFLVAVPLCLGIALASGAPLVAGLVSGVIGGLVVSLLSGSQLMVSGPAAGLTAIVIAAIGQLGSFEAFLVSVVLAGVLQLGLAALRAGIIGYFFPSSVIKGMLAAIGLILILKQLPHAVGYDVNAMGDEAFRESQAGNTFTSLVAAARALTLGPTLLGALSLVLLVLLDHPAVKRRARLLPGPLIIVVLGVLANELAVAVAPALTIDASHRVQLPQASSFAEWLGLISTPDWSALGRADTWRIALTIALVASLETLLSLEATDKIDPYKREAPPNRELFAQGVGNTLCGLIGGLPITGVIVRSSVNIDAGARTRASAFFHGVLLLVAVLAFPGLLNRIPLASLAAILLFTGYKLAHPRLFRTAYRLGWSQFLPFVATVVAIVLTDLLVGIGVGLAVGAFFVLKNNYEHPFHRTTEHSHEANVLRLTLSEETSFLNKASIVSTLNALPPGTAVEVDGTRARYIDYDVLEILNDFRETARLRNIRLRLLGIPEVATTPHH
jgi:MFS superfamily sulfate permease-like transporter